MCSFTYEFSCLQNDISSQVFTVTNNIHVYMYLVGFKLLSQNDIFFSQMNIPNSYSDKPCSSFEIKIIFPFNYLRSRHTI